MRRKIVAIAIAIGLSCASHVAYSEGSHSVSIRAIPGVPDEVIEYVARISTPSWVDVPKGESPETFIDRTCGAYTSTFEKIFYELNPDFKREPINAVRKVRVPACIRWWWRRAPRRLNQQPVVGIPVRPFPDETLQSVLLRKVGIGGSQQLKCAPEVNFWRCNKTLRELVAELNPNVNLDALERGKELILPLVTAPTTFKIRPGLGVSANEVVVKISEIAARLGALETIVRHSVAPPVRLLDAYPHEQVEDVSCKNPTSRFAHWPYDANAVAEVVTRTLKAHQSAGQPLHRTTISVIDTGLDPKFPLDYLRRRRVNDRYHSYGMGILFTDRIDYFEADGSGRHGTQVAHIVTGASGLRAALPNDLQRLLGINVVNLMEQQGDAWVITSDGLQRGVSWAAENADIANISVGSEVKIETVLKAARDRKTFLLVVAAGNDKFRLDVKPLYPAVWGGTSHEGGTQITTVAAHQGDFTKAEFTNYSNVYADLFAPGCAVPFSSNVADEAPHGTSFAAPLVTMTAGLLRAFNLGQFDAWEIKKRLEASVDYLSGNNQVVWSGRLNIAKALSLYDDVLERHSRPGTLIFGKWLVDGTTISLCDDEDELEVSSIKKIMSPRLSGWTVMRYVLEDPNGVLRRQPSCTPRGQGIKFAEVDDSGRLGQPFDVPWDDLLDLVPSSFKRGSVAPQQEAVPRLRVRGGDR